MEIAAAVRDKAVKTPFPDLLARRMLSRSSCILRTIFSVARISGVTNSFEVYSRFQNSKGPMRILN